MSLWRSFRAWLAKPGVRKKLAFILVIGAGLGLGLAYGAWTRACVAGACPSIGVLESYRPAQATKVFAADGRLITDLGLERRTVLALNDIAPEARAAFLAVEDKRFYNHGGIDFWRILGAVKADVMAMRFEQGFSTITMQLARNVFPERLPKRKDVRRKIREIQVALELERTYSKDRIYELYLNQVFLGNRAFGVETAAQRYLGKSARSLNVAEAALLAGINQAPTRYDPLKHPDRAVARRNVVINLMRDQGYLSDNEAERWKAYPLALSTRQDFGDVAPYFVEWVRQQLAVRFGQDLYNKGYRVYTTLDLDMQLSAERAVQDQLTAIESGLVFGPYRHTTYQEYLDQSAGVEAGQLTPYLQGALISMEAKTGAVRAMVGGRDYEDSKFNRAVQAQRQPGSTFKPFVYAAAIRAGKPASYIIDDQPKSYEQAGDTMPWEPQNYEGDFMGPMTIRRGLYKSRNMVAVQLGMELGIEPVIGEAVRFGIASKLPKYPSLFLGSASVNLLEMVSAYTAFATLGERAAAFPIVRVEDERGNIIWQPQERHDRVMDTDHMWIVTNMLQDVVLRGTAYNAVWNGGFQLPAAGKTGTTDDGTDVWFIGFTSEIVTGVWMGLDTPQKIKASAAGGALAAPAWTAFMREVYQRRARPAGWPRPDALVTREVDNSTGYLATSFCPRTARYWEWFVPGTEPRDYCQIHSPFARAAP
ncbi:MAG: PBP1A family penicillin-binding protein [Gemmatimonadetes bacterium]|nr:PBP1A family penicillin-binding protein [Gemmatimonadota bacterium]